MPENKKDFFNIAEVSSEFRATFGATGTGRDHFMISAMLAQAQQLSIISKHLADISESLAVICGKAKAG